MSPRVYREECGVPGCDFTAGPSRDLNRVMRIVDQHRATAHVLQVPAEERKRRPVAGSQSELRRQMRERSERIVPHLATYRRFEVGEPGYVEPERGGCGDRQTRQARREAQRALVATVLHELATLLPPSIDPTPPVETPWRESLRVRPVETTEDRRERRRRAAERSRRKKYELIEAAAPTIMAGLKRPG